jgi:hypothetical protein
MQIKIIGTAILSIEQKIPFTILFMEKMISLLYMHTVVVNMNTIVLKT